MNKHLQPCVRPSRPKTSPPLLRVPPFPVACLSPRPHVKSRGVSWLPPSAVHWTCPREGPRVAPADLPQRASLGRRDVARRAPPASPRPRPPPVSPVPCVLVLPGTLFLVLSSDSRLSLPGVLFVLRVAHSHEVADLPASLPATASPLAPLSCPSFCDAPLTDLGALRAGVRHTRGRAALRSKLPTASRGPWAALQALGSSAAWASRAPLALFLPLRLLVRAFTA